MAKPDIILRKTSAVKDPPENQKMSLFENDEYQWRETYFVLFDEAKRPSAKEVQELLDTMNNNYQLQNIRDDDAGKFESVTLISPDDYAAMDLTCVTGEELAEQLSELAEELTKNALDDEERKAISRIRGCSARLEVYHFEQLVFVGSSSHDDEFDDFMDPGSLLVVLEQLALLCDGIIVDPQSNSLL